MRKKNNSKIIFALVIWEMFAITGILLNISTYSATDLMFTLLFAVAPIALFILKLKKDKRLSADPTREIAFCGIEHIEGLELGQGTKGNISLNKEKLTLTFSGNKYTIDNNKVLILETKTDTEIQNIATQSGSGMLIGAAVSGLLGAMVGGRVKNKEKRYDTNFLVLNYRSNDEVKFIIMKVTGNIEYARNITSEFRQLGVPNQKLTVEL